MDERKRSSGPVILYSALVTALSVMAITFLLLSTLTYRLPDFSKCFEVEMHETKICPNTERYVQLANISTYLKDAILVSEDASFYGHRGFDWFELKKSFEKNLDKGSFARGGSTITQQLAKNLFLSPQKSILRKIHEAIYAIRIEGALKKDKIFEIYLNVIEFGEKLYGVQNASRFYFQKPAADLNLLESSFLAILLPSPKKYSQSYRDGQLTEFVRGRIIDTIDRLRRFKKISQAEADYAKANIDSFPWTNLVWPSFTNDEYTEDIIEDELNLENASGSLEL